MQAHQLITAVTALSLILKGPSSSTHLWRHPGKSRWTETPELLFLSSPHGKRRVPPSSPCWTYPTRRSPLHPGPGTPQRPARTLPPRPPGRTGRETLQIPRRRHRQSLPPESKHCLTLPMRPPLPLRFPPPSVPSQCPVRRRKIWRHSGLLEESSPDFSLAPDPSELSVSPLSLCLHCSLSKNLFSLLSHSHSLPPQRKKTQQERNRGRTERETWRDRK
mmetsp:Transcript_11098/g.21417  ORF Transcript_11098/g.21417 Transcript_11098/m.21417 type:complete len:219 (-) Transcript_11098:641-1297(-)